MKGEVFASTQLYYDVLTMLFPIGICQIKDKTCSQNSPLDNRR